ncbi:hypothetical protein [Pedobacter sp. V48]|uniref:hypothetical protein n=1 Tax=Pedobacter sp. V48 TaxID=509635 RepID=UPI0003E4D5C9|nr:hypothetical protein [Pedobacter sp. V48]ETZ19125.1 hypothetical protein N824_10305 [Pedobacter sp. V48]
MTLLPQIEKDCLRLTPSWQMLRYISSIERFDAVWPDVKRKEQQFLEEMKSLTRSNGFLSDMAKDWDINTALQKMLPVGIGLYAPFKELIYWFETTTEIPIPVKCALFIHCLLTDQSFRQFGGWISLKVAGILLIHSGYTWIQWLNLTCLKKARSLVDDFNSDNIDHWVLSCLMVMIDFQEILMLKLSKYGAGQNLTIKYKLLLYIIQHNPGIATRRIAIKLGKSEVIVRRMLVKLRALALIERYGAGPKTYHVLI